MSFTYLRKAFLRFRSAPIFQCPSVCQICHAWPSQAICESCINRFAQPTQRCPTCALSLTNQICDACEQQASPLDACVAAVSYEFPWSDCVARFKFQNDPGFGKAMAHLMRHAPWVEPTLEAAHCIVAMPLSISRLRERGFNQAYELARRLAADKSNPYVLQRVPNNLNDNAHQVGASREERLSLVQDAFWVPPEQIQHVRGRRVVIVDDVMTTGASLYEAARALRAVGAKHITGLVFARTEKHEVEKHAANEHVLAGQ